MRTVLAKVRLATGNVGWYDPLTNIHLTIQSPEALVYEGQNTSNLKKGVMYKTITVIGGSLSEPSNTVTPTKIKTITEQPVPKKQEEVTKVDEPIVEKAEEKVEEAVIEQEVVEEKPKKKATRKKKSE